MVRSVGGGRVKGGGAGCDTGMGGRGRGVERCIYHFWASEECPF